MNNVDRPRGLSARLKLSITMCLLVVGTGAVLFALVYLFLLRYIPDGVLNTKFGEFAPSRKDLARAFIPRALWALGFLVAGSGIGSWFLAGHLLRPLARMQRTANSVSSGDLNRRVHLHGPRTEFSDVADAMDSMLDRLKNQITQQQRFAANASHELRTPLAALRTTLEVGPSQQLPGPQFIQRLQHITAKAERSVDSLLTLSRAQSNGLAKMPIDLSLLLEDLVEQYLPEAITRGLEFDIQLGDLPAMEADADLLEHAVANLVRNALAYSNSKAWLCSGSDGSTVEITVENDGEVLTAEQAQLILEPFHRLERIGSIKSSGSGLGLPIVAAVVQAHGGSFRLAPRPAGGLSAVIRLPALKPWAPSF